MHVEPRGRYSGEVWIGVCREGSWTLTLFKDLESVNWYLFSGPNIRLGGRFHTPLLANTI